MLKLRKMQKNVLLKGAMTILGASIITRILGFIFRIYIAKKLDAQGMGLYQLVTSLYMLAITFTTAGISLSVSCMVSENIETKRYGSSRNVLKISIFWALFVSTLVLIALLIFAVPISQNILRDARTLYSIIFLAPSLPFMAVSSCVKGYFYALRKPFHPSNSTVIEQIAKMFFIFCLINFYIDRGDEYACALVSLGMTVGEIVSCIYIGIIYHIQKRPIYQQNFSKRKILSKILKISVPVQTSSTFSSALRLAENILIIEGLKIFTHGDHIIATGTYGIIKGMVLPLLLFPTSFLQAVITVLIPELSGASAARKETKIKRACQRALQLTILMGIYITAIFLLFPGEISSLFYKNPNVAVMIKSLCILCPLMYLEMVCVGILNAIGEQIASMKYKIIDSALRLVLIWILVPKGGVDAFLIIMIMSNIFTSVLNLYRLLKVTCLPLCLSQWFIKPFVAILLSSFVSIAIKNKIIEIFPKWFAILSLILIIATIYLIFLFMFKCLGSREVDFLKTCLKSKNKVKCKDKN